MPKYLFHSTYVGEGVKGLLKDGGSSRRTAADKAAQAVGGSVEAMYFAFGEAETYVIADLPDNAAATALSLTINATGTVVTKPTVLMTPEEVDIAVKQSPSYRGPGQ